MNEIETSNTNKEPVDTNNGGNNNFSPVQARLSLSYQNLISKSFERVIESSEPHTFVLDRPADALQIRQGIMDGLLLPIAMELANRHPVVASGYIEYLSAVENAEVQDITVEEGELDGLSPEWQERELLGKRHARSQSYILSELKRFLDMGETERGDYYHGFSKTSEIDEEVIVHGLKWGLIGNGPLSEGTVDECLADYGGYGLVLDSIGNEFFHGALKGYAESFGISFEEARAQHRAAMVDWDAVTYVP